MLAMDGNRAAMHRNVAEGGAVLTPARRHGLCSDVPLQIVARAGDRQRYRFVEPARSVIDAQYIGKLSLPLAGHHP